MTPKTAIRTVNALAVFLGGMVPVLVGAYPLAAGLCGAAALGLAGWVNFDKPGSSKNEPPAP